MILFSSKKVQNRFFSINPILIYIIGDMALLGYTLIGEYNAHAGSHHLNHLLTKKLFESEENYEIVDLDLAEEESKVFEIAYAQAK